MENPTEKKTRLNPKKLAFITAYTTLGSETFHNGAGSARFAGYLASRAKETAWELLQDETISDLIAQREKEEWDWNFEKWSQKLISYAKEVPATHSNAPRFMELIGKSKGFISDSTKTTNNLYVLNSDDLQKIRESIREKLSTSYNTIEVKAIDTPNAINTNELRNDTVS